MKATWLAYLQKFASFLSPPGIKVNQSDLVKVLEMESETLQNITDFFLPIMKNFRLYFFWEQKKTDLQLLGKDCIVPTESAAAAYDEVERSDIAADHEAWSNLRIRKIWVFHMVLAAMCRYCNDTPEEIRLRPAHAVERLDWERRREVHDTLRHVTSAPSVRLRRRGHGALTWRVQRSIRKPLSRRPARGHITSKHSFDDSEGRLKQARRYLDLARIWMEEEA